jgi:hypothetical protein
MFERYTEKARRVIFFARYEASNFGSPYIGTEHLLLGLLREDKALSNRFLRSHTALESIRKQIEEHTTAREHVSTSVDLPLSNECQRVLAYAAEEAERLSHKHIGTEHLLLGLLREEKSFAAQILQERGLRLAAARDTIASTEPAVYQFSQHAEHRFYAKTYAEFAETYVEFIDISKGERIGLFPLLLFRPQLPRVGEELILGSRTFRVRDVVYVFQDLSPQPEEITEVQKRIKFIVHRMEDAIANNEFEKARFYSNEERKERDNLRALREKYHLDDSATGAESQRLPQIVIKLEPTGETPGKPTSA